MKRGDVSKPYTLVCCLVILVLLIVPGCIEQKVAPERPVNQAEIAT